MTTIKAVIFDHDGTLVDSEKIHWQSWLTVISPYSLSFQEYETNLSGVPSIASSQWIIDRFQLTTTAQSLLTKKKSVLQAFFSQQAFPLKAHVAPLITKLAKRSIPMAIASGASTNEIRTTLEYHELTPFFQAVISGDHVVNNKPSPDVYQLAISRLALNPNECIAVEDTDSGQQAAEAAGIPCLRLRTPTDMILNPELVFSSMKEVGAFIIKQL